MSINRYRLAAVHAFCIACAVSANIAAAQPSDYYYFKERRELTVDVTRLAFQALVATRSTATSRNLRAMGVDSSRVETFAVSGWSLVGTTPEIKSVVGIRRAVRDLAAAGAAAFVSPVFVGEDGGPLMVTPTILVGFRPHVSASRAEAILVSSGAGVMVDRDWGNMPRAYRLLSESRDGFAVLEAANKLAQLPEVRFAEPDMLFTGQGGLIPNDPMFSDCWGLDNTGQFGGMPDMDMDAPEAWDITIGDPSIKVVIIDTGVQQNHPDINQIPGTDTTSDASTTGDPLNEFDNHGTAVAGCVSAIINNNLGVTGVAPGCPTASARTFIAINAAGNWDSAASWTVDSLVFAESIGARVTNNSNSYGFTSSAIAAKYEQTRNDGMVHFSSAHNNGVPVISYPSSLPTVNAVAALAPSGARASFSNFGPGLFISAPGETVLSTDRTGNDGYVAGDFVFVNGTSFASPYTSGVAALVLSSNPALSAGQVESILASTAVDLGMPGYEEDFGWGFVNAHRALLAANPVCSLNKLAASPVAVGGRFGTSVAASGTTAIVGAPNAVGVTGTAYLFDISDPANPTEVFQLTALDGALGDLFAVAVDVSGTTAIAGATLDDDAGIDSGSAYLFDTGTGQQVAKLNALDAAAGDSFGASVAVSGATAIVGAPLDDDAGVDSGSAYLFDVTTGQQLAKFTAAAAAGGDSFGSSAAMSGAIAVIGAEGTAGAAGTAYVFDVSDPANPAQLFKLTASDAAANDEFGHRVAVSGSIAVVGATGNDDAGESSGSAYVFDVTTGQQLAKLTAGDAALGDLFGSSVATNGGTAVITATSANAVANNSGAAYVFDLTDPSNPVQVSKPVASDATTNSGFGDSVALSGQTAFVGTASGDGSADVFAVGPDCNGNLLPDACDIARGLSIDLAGDGIPDECQCIIASPALADVILSASGATVSSVKSRFVSFAGGDAGLSQAVRLKFVSLPGTFSIFNNTSAWVDLPQPASELPGKSLTDPIGAEATFLAATLSSTPVFADWSAFGTVHVHDERIIPSRLRTGQPLEPALYEIQLVTAGCDINSDASFSVPLSITNARWADIAQLAAGDFRAPDGTVAVDDTLALLAKFGGAAGAPIKPRAEMLGVGGAGPVAAIDGKIGVTDLLEVLSAFGGGAYPFTP